MSGSGTINYPLRDEPGLKRRPFFTRKIFQEILGLEGSKISWGKKTYEEIFPKILLAKNFLRGKKLKYSQLEVFGDKREIYAVQDEAYPLRVLDDAYCSTYTQYKMRRTPSQYWTMPTALRTHGCVLCCTRTCIESHKLCPKSLDEHAWQDCCTRWNDD